MFDQLLQNPLILALPHILSVVFGFVLSRAVELVPSFATWWDPLPNDRKIVFRGWVGLGLAVALVIFGYFSGMITISLVTLTDWLVMIASVIISWLLFVGGAEGTYRLTEANLPRKQSDWEG